MDKAYPCIGGVLALLVPILSDPGVTGWQISLIQAAFVAIGFYGRSVFSN